MDHSNRSVHVTSAESDRIKAAVQWNLAEGAEFEAGFRLVLNHFKPIKQVTWHGRGDYFSTVMPEGANRSALIHQLSKRRTQIPFSKSKGLIQCVLFHPVKPCLFVAVSGGTFAAPFNIIKLKSKTPNRPRRIFASTIWSSRS